MPRFRRAGLLPLCNLLLSSEADVVTSAAAHLSAFLSTSAEACAADDGTPDPIGRAQLVLKLGAKKTVAWSGIELFAKVASGEPTGEGLPKPSNEAAAGAATCAQCVVKGIISRGKSAEIGSLTGNEASVQSLSKAILSDNQAAAEGALAALHLLACQSDSVATLAMSAGVCTGLVRHLSLFSDTQAASVDGTCEDAAEETTRFIIS